MKQRWIRLIPLLAVAATLCLALTGCFGLTGSGGSGSSTARETVASQSITVSDTSTVQAIATAGNARHYYTVKSGASPSVTRAYCDVNVSGGVTAIAQQLASDLATQDYALVTEEAVPAANGLTVTQTYLVSRDVLSEVNSPLALELTNAIFSTQDLAWVMLGYTYDANGEMTYAQIMLSRIRSDGGSGKGEVLLNAGYSASSRSVRFAQGNDDVLRPVRLLLMSGAADEATFFTRMAAQAYRGWRTMQTTAQDVLDAARATRGRTGVSASGSFGSLSWTLSDGVLAVRGNGAMPEWQLGAPWYIYSGSVIRFVANSGVTSVSAGSLDGCDNLTQVGLAASVTSLGKELFAGCPAVAEVRYTGTKEAWYKIGNIQACGLTQNAVVRCSDVVMEPIVVTYGQTEARTMLGMVNQLRRGSNAWAWNSTDSAKVSYSGLGSLAYDATLEAVAMQRAAEIAVRFSHYRPDGTDPTSAFVEFGSDSSAKGENIAMGQATAEEAFAHWAEENENYAGQGHRRSMLYESFTAMGVGHVYYNGNHYWVMVLGNPSSTTRAGTADNSTRAVRIAQNS